MGEGKEKGRKVKAIFDFFGFKMELDIPSERVAFGEYDVPIHEQIRDGFRGTDCPPMVTQLRLVLRFKRFDYTERGYPLFKLSSREHNRIVRAIAGVQQEPAQPESVEGGNDGCTY